jgi:hypothetical protein
MSSSENRQDHVLSAEQLAQVVSLCMVAGAANTSFQNAKTAQSKGEAQMAHLHLESGHTVERALRDVYANTPDDQVKRAVAAVCVARFDLLQRLE